MKHLCFFLPAVTLGALLAACGGVPSTTEQLRQAGSPGMRACAEPSSAKSECEVIIQKTGVQADLAGWGPSDLQAAYNLPSSSKGKGQIVAIVDAYDNPNVASDLAAYRSHFGLPPAKFTKYNQEGQTKNYPKSCAGNDNWCVEIDLDVEMVSAACPNCTIYLVEAKDGGNLGTAEKEAVKLGAHIVSNSWDCAGICRGLQRYFDTSDVVYVAAAGDDSYGSNSPARLPNVVSVGGTILAKHGSTYKEIVWPFTGGGCANHTTKPSWQHDPDCKYRTQNDVAAVAWDVAEYDTYDSYTGWVTVAGTSIATPLIAATYALAGNARSQHAAKELWTLTTEQRKHFLHAITEGSDGDCGGSYLCEAGTGRYGTYSGPAGWGTPDGIGAF
ncbi:MAG TPA: S8 family serine peptidase [Candidatus Cybelea sp.]|nr:S8 family serine peptidase [Candidatus Cybelea sp.]